MDKAFPCWFLMSWGSSRVLREASALNQELSEHAGLVSSREIALLPAASSPEAAAAAFHVPFSWHRHAPMILSPWARTVSEPLTCVVPRGKHLAVVSYQSLLEQKKPHRPIWLSSGSLGEMTQLLMGYLFYISKFLYISYLSHWAYRYREIRIQSNGGSMAKDNGSRKLRAHNFKQAQETERL